MPFNWEEPLPTAGLGRGIAVGLMIEAGFGVFLALVWWL